MGAIRQTAALLQRQGRRGDTILAHINRREAELLRRAGGSGTVNPVTGLLEFWSDPSDSGGYGTDTTGNPSSAADSDGGGGGGGDIGAGGDGPYGGPALEGPAAYSADFSGAYGDATGNMTGNEPGLGSEAFDPTPTPAAPSSIPQAPPAVSPPPDPALADKYRSIFAGKRPDIDKALDALFGPAPVGGPTNVGYAPGWGINVDLAAPTVASAGLSPVSTGYGFTKGTLADPNAPGSLWSARAEANAVALDLGITQIGFTEHSGFFGFRDEVGYEPTQDAFTVSREFSLGSLLADVAGAVASFFVTGLPGMVAGHIASRVVEGAVKDNYSIGMAVADMTGLTPSPATGSGLGYDAGQGDGSAQQSFDQVGASAQQSSAPAGVDPDVPGDFDLSSDVRSDASEAVEEEASASMLPYLILGAAALIAVMRS